MNMITTDISRFMDGNVHTSEYAVWFGQLGWEQAFGIFHINLEVNYVTTGRKSQKINPQPCTADANDVINVIHRRAGQQDSHNNNNNNNNNNKTKFT